MAVATSGDAYQYMEHDGLKYSHIIDPRTGYGIHSQRNVTVIAKGWR
jgi:thiamine biosynthesis lipoprotein